MPEGRELTKDELQQILQLGKVDVGNDTLFSRTDKLRVDKTHLTLVISSGGSGAAAIKEAIATAKQKLEDDFAVYMKFIMIDSASRELDALAKSLGRKQLQILNLSTDGAQGRMNAKPRPDFYRKFVPGNYDTTKLNKDGAGRDRLTGKIKFYDDAAEGNYNDVVFRGMISSLFADGGDWSAHKDKSVDIMILAGLSGGNGSGTFEELAAHARYACEQQGVSTRVFGYLFLPDTVEEFEKSDPTAQKMLYTNGYAALKELESYMSIPFEPERKEYFYSRDGVTEIECSATKPLFNYPVLISGGYNESKSMMAESILNLAVESDGAFNQDSFYSNSIVTRNAYLTDSVNLSGGLLKADFYPEDSHSYAAIGYAYAAIPDEIVTANVVSNVSQKLYLPEDRGDGTAICFCTGEKRMDRFEMETQIRRLFSLGEKKAVTAASLWNDCIYGALKRESTLTENEGEITRQDINGGRIADYERGFHKDTRVIDGTKAMRSHLGQIFAGVKEKAQEVMRDYGPKAMEYLYTGMGPNNKEGKPEYFDISISSMLDYAKTQLFNIRQDTKRPRPENHIPGGLGEMLMKKRITEWKSKFHTALEYEVMQEIVKNLLATDGAWVKNLVNPMETYVGQCKAFADRLELLVNFYHSAGSPLDSNDYAGFLQESQTGNCVNLCNSADVYAWVKGQVSKKINSVGVKAVKKALVDSFAASPEVWTSESEGRTRAEFDRVMSECCELGKGAGGAVTISLSATSYFEHVLGQVDEEEVPKKADEIVKDLVSQLKVKSKPALKKMGGYSAENRFIMIPKSLQASKYGTAIESAFRSALQATGAKETGVSVSPSVSDIVCYQTSVANGLCDLTEVQKWETVYNEGASRNTRHLNHGEFGSSYVERTKAEIEKEKAIKEERKIPELGLSVTENIIFGTGLSWEHYPSIALRNPDNKGEAEFRRTMFDPIVDYAMKESLIQRKHTPGSSEDVYQYVVNLIPAGWENLDVEDYQQKGDDGKYARGERLFQHLEAQNALVQGEWQKPILLAGSGRFGEPYDFSAARTSGDGKTRAVIEDISKQYMRRMLRKNTKLFLELRETLCRYYEIVRKLELREQDYWYAYQVGQFEKYYGFGIILEEGGKWYALTDDSGNRQAFCSFTFKETNAYNEMEKKLYRADANWKFLLAFRKFTELDQKKLQAILDDKLNDMAQEDLEKLQTVNRAKMGAMRGRIQKEILNKYPNRETDDAIRKVFDIGTGEGDFYLKIMESMLEQWEEFVTDQPIPPAPKKETDTGNKTAAETWICPKCGRENPDEFLFCPIDMEPKPKKEAPGMWICPKCGRENPDEFLFCPVDMEPKPKKETPGMWVCPKCGRENPDEFLFCPVDMQPKPQPQETKPVSWKCPKCGKEHPWEFQFCPLDMTPRP